MAKETNDECKLNAQCKNKVLINPYRKSQENKGRIGIRKITPLKTMVLIDMKQNKGSRGKKKSML